MGREFYKGGGNGSNLLLKSKNPYKTTVVGEGYMESLDYSYSCVRLKTDLISKSIFKSNQTAKDPIKTTFKIK